MNKGLKATTPCCDVLPQAPKLSHACHAIRGSSSLEQQTEKRDKPKKLDLSPILI